jgi:hypothetical protein
VEEQHAREEITVAEVGPDPRLLFVLVSLLVGAAVAVVFLSGGDDGSGRVQLGRLSDLAEQTQGGPLRVAELPHLVVSQNRTGEPDYDSSSWGENDGAVRLSPTAQLVVLETRDPEDGAELTWCRSARAFVHPQGLRWYGADGDLLHGRGRRGMDRRGITVTGEGVVVDDGRWVQGVPLQSADTAWAPRGDCGLD